MPLLLVLAAVVAPSSTPPALAPAMATASPAPVDPARLALARSAAMAILPPGRLAATMSDLMGGLPFNLGAVVSIARGGPAKPTDQDAFAEARNRDPYFDRRMAITKRVFAEEFARLGPTLEPATRESIAVALADRYSAAQLASLNRFFATPDGAEVARGLLSLWTDPAYVRENMNVVGLVVEAIPDITRKVEAATAGLPKPVPVPGSAAAHAAGH